MRQKQFWPIIIIKNGIISIWYGRWCLFVVHDGRWRAEHIRSTQANTNVVPVPCGTRMEIEPNAKATAFESPFNRTECNANGPIHLFYLKYIYTHWVCNVCVCVVVEHQHWAGRTIIAKQTVFFSCVIWVCGVRLPDSTHYHAHSHHIQTYRPKMHEIHHICISVRIATECIADVRCDTSERSRMKMNVIYYTPIHIIICKCGWLWNPGTTGRGILFFSFLFFCLFIKYVYHLHGFSHAQRSHGICERGLNALPRPEYIFFTIVILRLRSVAHGHLMSNVWRIILSAALCANAAALYCVHVWERVNYRRNWMVFLSYAARCTVYSYI